MSDSNNIITNIPVTFSMTASAYYIQNMSDLYWSNSITISSKLAQISSIRHYRASYMMSISIYTKTLSQIPITVSLDCLELYDAIDLFYKNEEYLYNALIKTIPDKNEDNYKIRKGYVDMLIYTNKYISKLTNTDKSITNIDNKIFNNKFICLQCGRIYDDLENISDCDYCGAGINHIEYLCNIL